MLREHGWDVVVVERDLREELISAGFVGIATDSHTHWADLISRRDREYVVRKNGSGKTQSDAVVSAKRRYGSEQT